MTTTKGKKLKIEMVGFEKSYNWRADLTNARDITLEKMGMSELGDSGDLRRLIPGTMNLYLDANKLYSWDQYFDIIQQLPYLRMITLTANKFKRIPQNYLEGKNLA